ncbi:MAG: LysR family transcriptional regulator [Rheinheimera sp.]|nr:LysR family transcriptional regulator [Rheinheimera sp.]
MDRIETMKAFISVYEEGGFTRAANKLDMSNQLVSKYVSDLEEHLGVRLFNRTTRSVSLTEAGEQCVQHVRQILERIQDMEGGLGQLKNEAQGLLRINAPVSFSTKQLSPFISDFRKRYPAVGINLQLNDRQVDVVEEGFDLALRIGHLKSSSLIARRVAPIRLVLIASPEYLEKNGTPAHPDQLIPAHFLRYSYMSYPQDASPLMQSLKLSIKDQAAGLSCNNGDILVDAAMAGEGYALQPTFLVGDAIKQGKLKVILKEFEPEPMGLYVVYPHRKLMATKLRSFIDFISGYYGECPSWDQF